MTSAELKKFDARCCYLYERYGLLAKEIGDRLNVSVYAVWGAIKTHPQIYKVNAQDPRSVPRWSAKEEKRAHKLHQEGWSLVSIAKTLKRSVLEVVWLLLTNGKLRRDSCKEWQRKDMRPFFLSNYNQYRVRKLHASGADSRGIAAQIGAPNHLLVRQWLKEQGLIETPAERIRRIKKAYEKRVINWHLKGIAPAKVAERVGLSMRTVYLWQKQLGLEHRYQTGRWADRELRKEVYYEYAILVRRYTERTYKKYKGLIDPKNRRGPKWHVDHRVSIYDGYRHKLSAKLVAHPVNLVLISKKENQHKNERSSIDPLTLHSEARRWRRVHETHSSRSI